ncbi:hypothetical protein Tco_0433409, partial [Tanacetum coccineum]
KNLLKEDVSFVPVWVKLHGVPVTAFSKDGLSGRSSYARVMIELRADVELKDNIVVAMQKITREGHYICVGEKRIVKKPSQTSRGVPVGPKMGFKPQKEYRPVSKKPTANSSSNKNKGVEPTIEVSNSNPFEVLNSVDNDEELELLTSGQAILVDEAGNLLKKVKFSDDYDSKDERDSYGNCDYDDDPYDDMYEGQDLSQELQAICDNLDIRVRGRMKK